MKKGLQRTSGLPSIQHFFFPCASEYDPGDRGVTLIELLIVLTILAVASGIVGAVIYRGSGGLETRKTTKHIASTLRYARNQAVSKKAMYTFVVQENKKYGLYRDLSFDDDLDEVAPVLSRPIPDSLAVSFHNGEERKRVDFFPKGSSSGGTIVVDNRKGKNVFIVVNRLTGRVDIKKNLDE